MDGKGNIKSPPYVVSDHFNLEHCWMDVVPATRRVVTKFCQYCVAMASFRRRSMQSLLSKSWDDCGEDRVSFPGSPGPTFSGGLYIINELFNKNTLHKDGL